MKFSRKFLQNALYLRKIVLEIGLMEPSTIIDILKLKLYIGNKQKGGNTTQMIESHEELKQIEAWKSISLEEDPNNRY